MDLQQQTTMQSSSSSFDHNPSSAFHPDVLRATEALEPGAIQIMLSLKHDATYFSDDDDDGDVDGKKKSVVPPPTNTMMTIDDDDDDDDDDIVATLPKKWMTTRSKRTTVERRRVVTPENVPDNEGVGGARGGGGPAPTSLYAEGDEDHINPIHNIIRRDILEVFVDTAGVQKKDGSSITSTTTTRSGGRRTKVIAKKKSSCTSMPPHRIGLRCKFCKHLPGNKRANLSTIFPETLEGVYRACSVRFQKRHLNVCKHIPRTIIDDIDALILEGNSRGSKQHWVTSALRKGLRTSEDIKGIVYVPEGLN